MKDKKADIPLVILVIGVLAVCAITIFSFMSFSFKIGKTFSQVSVVEALDVKINEYLFYKNNQVPDEIIEEALNISENYLEQTGDGILVRYNLPR